MTKTDRLFERILNLIVLLGASMLTVPLSLMIFMYEDTVVLNGAERIMPVFAVVSTFFGYLIQFLFSKLIGKKASRDGFADVGEGIVQGFSLGYAIIPILISVVLAVVMYVPADSFLENMYLAGNMVYYTPLYAIFVCALFFIASLIGIVIWFYPVERLTNMNVLLIAGVLFYAEMFFATLMVAPLFSRGLQVLSDSLVTTVIGPPFIIFSICLLIVYNQNNLQRKFRGSVVSVITPSARMYNLFIVFVVLLLLVLLCLLVYVLLSGFFIILYALGFIISYNLFYGQEYGNGNDIEAEYFGSEIASQQFNRNVMSPENQYMLAIFFLLILTAAALFVLSRTGYLKKIIWRIREWFRDLIHSFLIGKDIFKNAGHDRLSEEVYNYKDEKKQIQNAAIRDFNDLAENTDSYRLFMQRLSRLKDYNEQLCYAYAVLRKMYKKTNINIKHSDTPREAEEKVRRSVTAEEITKITADFERIQYAEEKVSDSEASAILSGICEVVKRYMY